jgi:hypothetical protein
LPVSLLDRLRLKLLPLCFDCRQGRHEIPHYDEPSCFCRTATQTPWPYRGPTAGEDFGGLFRDEATVRSLSTMRRQALVNRLHRLIREATEGR